MLDRMPRFTEAELEKVHDSSMSILAEIGVVFQSPRIIEIFQRHGFQVERDVVYFDERQVARALETVPNQFEITARDPEKSVTVGVGDPVCAPGYGAPFIIDAAGDQRRSTLEDYANFCKLVHTSEDIDMLGYLMVDPADVPSEHAHLHMMGANLTLSDKPFMGPPVPTNAAREAIEMAELLWGGEGSLKDKYVILPTINPVSPLIWDDNMAGAIAIYAENNQPIMFENLMMSGSTGPITLAGTIVLQNAEILSGLVLTQLVTPGLPVIFGNIAGTTDMRTGNLSIGAPEGSMLVSATAQMAQFYGVPGRSGGGLTDAHIPDIQAGIESALCLLIAMRGGITFLLHACGILGAYMAMSYEKFIIDEEIIAMIKRMLRPIHLTDAAIDLDSIRAVGHGGEFLSHPRTFELFRQEHFDTRLFNRQGYPEWKNSDARDVVLRAGELVRDRLESYEKPPISREIEDDLGRYIRARVADGPSS